MATYKLVSWNVNGIRAVAQKGFFDSLNDMNADVLCLQETKAQDDQVAGVLEGLSDHHFYSNSAEKKGYSGTAIISKAEPLDVQPDIGVKKHDTEGRVLRAEYEHFHLVTAYVPNSGNELKRLDYRKTWDKAFRTYLKKLAKEKPVVLCGDLNVAHQPIDLARPKGNYNKTAGYTQDEIDGLTGHLKAGFIDTFRFLHPDKEGAYSWWSYRAGARGKNIGWRIDYFLASKSLEANIKQAYILPEVMGSDHCPVVLELEF